MAELTEHEFINKYGDTEVTFYRYYKYSFSYTGDLPDGKKIRVTLGGNADDIYRYEVVSNDTCIVRDLYPYLGIVIKNGEIID